MYLEHYGFRVLPFENVPDPAFFFNEGDFQRILRRITSAVASGRGLMVVAGPIGSGKTTLSQRLMADLPESTVHLWLAEPPGTDRELFQMILQRLGSVFAWDSRVHALGVLRDGLLKLHAAGGQCLVVIDESHKFTDEVLEAVRLLNNLEQGATKLIQILMLGQEELSEMLTRAGREPFRQRIANFEVLGRMAPPQVRDYIRHRLRVAGGAPGLFPDLVLDAIAAACEGIPRLTNSICDRALLHAFEGGKSCVDPADLLHAAEEVGVYRKAFHFLVGQGRTATEQPAEALPPASAPGISFVPPAPAELPDTGHGAAGLAESRLWISPPSESIELPRETITPEGTPRRQLLGPLALLAGGVAALAASLLYYCSRATAVYGGECLAHLFQDLAR